ncbi:MAG: hydrolase [Nitrospirae bacterium]|nr:hydrolase [Nitrospirota bacterium]
MEKFFLDKTNTALVIIDIQERLASVMKVKETVIQNCLHLIELSKTYGIPIILTEQYPKGLGQTVEEIRKALPEYRPLEKMTFTCCEEQSFLDEIEKLNKRTIIIAGMEAHVCVLQTCISLLKNGYNVHVVKDAVSSRTKENWKAGIEFMRDAGAVITCTEIVLFQILKIAGTEEFKAISRRIK